MHCWIQNSQHVGIGIVFLMRRLLLGHRSTDEDWFFLHTRTDAGSLSNRQWNYTVFQVSTEAFRFLPGSLKARYLSRNTSSLAREQVVWIAKAKMKMVKKRRASTKHGTLFLWYILYGGLRSWNSQPIRSCGGEPARFFVLFFTFFFLLLSLRFSIFLCMYVHIMYVS